MNNGKSSAIATAGSPLSPFVEIVTGMIGPVSTIIQARDTMEDRRNQRSAMLHMFDGAVLASQFQNLQVFAAANKMLDLASALLAAGQVDAAVQILQLVPGVVGRTQQVPFPALPSGG